MPMAKYEGAKQAAINGKFDEAYDAFISLGEYSDAKRQAELVYIHKLCQEKDYASASSNALVLGLDVNYQYVLYGGTAIALHLGNRQSVDFDFFSDTQNSDK